MDNYGELSDVQRVGLGYLLGLKALLYSYFLLFGTACPGCSRS